MSIGSAITKGYYQATSSRLINVSVTEYFPVNSRMEGGAYDHKKHLLQTLDDYLDGKASYVSVARDDLGGPPANASEFTTYGYKVLLPEICSKLGVKHIEFRLVDTGGWFRGAGKKVKVAGCEPIDICRSVKPRYPSVSGVVTYLVPVGVSMMLP